MAPAVETHKHYDKDGHFRRVDSVFRDSISRDPDSKFPAEKDRYALYINMGCPWAHRTIITLGLKNLGSIIQLIKTDFDLTKDGWLFTGKNGSEPADPLYGFKSLSGLYYKADPNYSGRFTVPMLWDKKTETVVNNESSEIIRMFYSEFDDLLPASSRESAHPAGGFYPPQLRAEIDSMNDWVYHTINNGVYKCGFAGSQEAYDANVYPLFASLDRLESHLGQPGHSPYLFGAHITEADIRLYTTLARFDVAYYTIFQCNLKMIRHDYPRLSRWLRNLYWDQGPRTNGGVFHKTTVFHVYKFGYLRAKGRQSHGGSDVGWSMVIPAGPLPDILPLTDAEKQAIETERLESLSLAGQVSSSDDETTIGAPTPGSSVEELQRQPQNAGEEGEEETPATTTKKEWPADEELDALPPKQQIQARTTYSDENAKWEKQIKRASKGAPPNVHLAL